MMTIRQFYLLKLAEECAKVAQSCSKQIQFGAETCQADGPSTTKVADSNHIRLRQEILDLLAVVTMLEERGEIISMGQDIRAYTLEAKRVKIAKYLVYSQSLGQVEPGA